MAMFDSEPEPTLDPTTSSVDDLGLREVLASFPAGVVVVTAVDGDGTPRGLTVSAFCSVSAEPPLVLVCVDKGSNTLPAIHHSGGFTVNILAGGREDVARAFASKQEDKFLGLNCRPPGPAKGGPILSDHVAAYLVCDVQQAVEAGDHWVFIAEVLETALAEEDLMLLYHRRSFSSVGGVNRNGV
jgi:flavin reductase (DIM6/NTAB) family NADH-FMN oxidoreductase RutF